MEPSKPSGENGARAVLEDALWRLDIAERALRDARAGLANYYAAALPSDRPAQPAPQAPAGQPTHAAFQGGPTPAPAAGTAPARPTPPAPPAPAAPPAYPARPARERVVDPKKRERTLIGAVAIGGTVITLAGVALLVGMAIQAGLLGPLGRVILAYVVAAALWAAAWRFRAKAPAAGVTALLVTSYYAATATAFLTVTWLRWWPGWLGAVVMALFYGAYLLYADRFREGLHVYTLAWLATGATVAGYLFPFDARAGGWVALALPVLTLTYSALRRHDILRGLGAIEVLLTLLAQDAGPGRLGTEALVILACVAAVALVALVVYAPTRKHAIGEWAAGIIVPSVLLAEAAIHAPSLLLMWLAMAALLLIAGIGWGGTIGALALGAVPVVFALFSLDTYEGWTAAELPDPTRQILWVLLCLAFFAGAVVLLPYLTHTAQRVAWAVGTLLMVSRLAAGVLWDPGALVSWGLLGEAIVLAGALAAAWFLRSRLRGVAADAATTEATKATGVMGGALLLAALFLSMLAAVGILTYAGAILGGQAGLVNAFYGAHALVSVAWMILAARLLLNPAHAFTRTGVILAVVAVAKLTFFDLSATTGIFRALAFLISGIVLLTIAVRRTSAKGASVAQAQAQN